MIDPKSAKSIFLTAVEKPLSERGAFLDEAVGDNADLRVRVEALLHAHDDPNGFLDRPVAQFTAIDHMPDVSPSAEGPGKLIGPYKLLEQIGEGGMGAVYMADQQSPVRRRVALKIIKAGMDTRQVIARFEAERQALAMMDHPNIARVLDAGATDSGRPYFVMELVRGIPITEYCDQANLPIRQRLELFIQVCDAVQHAHQKGIIHRDLKPSNVLVTINDGRATPKVIDFGVAKATNQQLTEKTLFTAFAQMVGTPLYMSPEQADMTSVDIDTRSDIYSLGVLLYELLTGTTPFDQQRLRDAAFDEMRRIIREEEPPRPSTRISTLGEMRPALAGHRQVNSQRLSQLLRGDLDWIVMRSLEKDRGRRYPTASDLAADVSRHLRDEIVSATPPSTTYRLSKLFRRHKTAFTAVTVIASAVLIALIVSVTMYRQERFERNQAELSRLHEQAQRKQAEVNFDLARDAVNHLTDIAQNRLMDPSDLATIRRDMLEDAAKFYETFAQSRSDDPAVIIEAARAEQRAGILRYTIGQPWEAEAHELRAIALIEGLYNAQPNSVEYRTELGNCYIDIGRLYQHELNDTASAEKAYRRAKDLFRPLFDSAPENHDAQFYMYWACLELGTNLTDCDRGAEAIVELKQALKISEHFVALASDSMEDASTVAQVRLQMGDCAARMGTYIEAEAEFRAAILILGRIHVAHPEDEWTTYNFAKSQEFLAEMLTIIGRPQEAEQLLREALAEIEPIAQRRSQYKLMSTHLAALNEHLGDSLFAQGRFAEAHDAYIKAQDGRRRIHETHTDAPAQTLGMIYLLVFCPDKSVRDPVAATSIARAALQRTPRIQYLWGDLGASLYQTGDWQGAIHAFEMAQQIGPKDLGCMRYVLALAQFKSGQPELARASLAQAERWAATTPPRYREPRFFAPEARQVILGSAAPPPAAPVPTTMSAESGSHP